MRNPMRFPAGHLLVLALIVPGFLRAQTPTSANACGPSPAIGVLSETSEVADLPVDRIADLLALEPGVTSLDQGDLSIRGAGPGALAIYLDGVPVTPGHRGASPLAGGSYFGERGVGIAVGTNGFDNLRLHRGLGPAEFGNGRGAALEIATAGECTPNGLRGGLASDALLGDNNGLGFNRATLEGRYSRGKFRVGGAAVFEGLKSERLGLEQNESPIFVAGGIDTSVTFDPGGGPITVDITRFRSTDGIRIPASANSAYTLNGFLGYEFAAGQRIQLSGYASQEQDRVFDYQNLYNLAQTLANRRWSRVVTGSWFGRLKQAEALQLNGEAHLSWQTDRVMGGPLSASGERDTRDPFGGFLISPVDFRIDFDNFAVNDELVRNFRTNNGRLSPYDLRNPDQYSLIDIYRNNAYGLNGFSEAGGPVGRLTLSRENRLVAKAVVDGVVRDRHRLRLGFEWTKYDLDFYQSQLTSQALSNAYIESPTRAAVFGDYGLTLGMLEVNAGLRWDRFKTGASRPDFPRISTAPGFDPANPTAGFTADKAHSRFSPQFRAAYQALSAVRFNAGIGWVAQMPDFASVFSGLNTDLSTTSTTQVYGTDLDFEHALVGQIGAEVQLRPRLKAEANLWHRKDEDLVETVLVQELDPSKNSNADIYRFRNEGTIKTNGVDLRVTRQFATGRAWLSYTFTDQSRQVDGFLGNNELSVPFSRPHTVTGAVLYQTPESAPAFLREIGVYGAFRVASGTAYTRCAPLPGNESIFSDGFCAAGFDGEINGARLPTLKLVDLRISRGFNLGAAHLVAFADAHNLLNSRNEIRVFAQTGKTSNSSDRALFLNGNLGELANEADANGVRQVDGTIDLSFGGAPDPRAACGSWTGAAGQANVPNCVYLVNAETRWGNGDHLFTTAEQTRASDALYQVARGLQNFTGPGRRVRIGLELRF